MARKVVLESILNKFRAECRLSLNAAHNDIARESQIILLQRKQEWLWQDFDWPHLRVDRFIELAAGQRYYDMPADLDIDRVQTVAVRYNSYYAPVLPDITDAQYAAYDSDLDVRGWPVRRWRITEDEQMEVWPVPDSSYDAVTLEGRLKITGIKTLADFINDNDRADLDDRLIVLHAAGEYLASKGAPDAQVKLDMASQLYVKLRGHLLTTRKIRLFDRDSRPRTVRVPLAVHYPSGS